ncbi:MAG: histidinol-phosphate transaminase [Pseudomonadota bacterium]
MSTDAKLLSLARPDIRTLKAYVPANYADGLTRLNANEAPWTSASDHSTRGLNHYPPARPQTLTETLADHYAVDNEHLFVTRGTSEAIDLLIRCFCRPSIDRVVISPPTFGMYQVYADIQGVAVDRVPLHIDDARTRLPVDEIIDAWTGTHRLVFVTTPNNPTGGLADPDDIERLAVALLGRGIVVIDAAYIEFADPTQVMSLARFPNVVVLRTLSKAFGMAGARCGSLIADPTLIDLVARVMPPYAMPTPSIEATTSALVAEQESIMPARIAELIQNREQLKQSLSGLPSVTKIWDSDANFLLVAFDDAAAAMQAAYEAGYLLRDFSNGADTHNCLRITVGTREDNNKLLLALGQVAST